MWPKIRLGNGIWTKFGLGNGIYSPPSGPASINYVQSLKFITTSTANWQLYADALSSALRLNRCLLSQIPQVSFLHCQLNTLHFRTVLKQNGMLLDRVFFF